MARRLSVLRRHLEHSAMDTPRARSLVWLLAISALMMLPACEPNYTGAAKVDYQRSQYGVELTSFTIREFVEPQAEPTEEADADVEADTEAEPIGEEGTEDALPVVRQDAYIDLLVRTDAKELLPGLTVDIYHQGSDGSEKGVYKQYIDTSGVVRAGAAQVGIVIEGVDYAEGDGFAVQIVNPVPEGERSQYREFEGV